MRAPVLSSPSMRDAPQSHRGVASLDAPGVTPTVMTVLGPVPADQLGLVLPHEHLLVQLWFPPENRSPRTDEPVSLRNLGWVRQHWGFNLDNMRLTSERLAIQELSRFKAAGGGTLVDLTLPGIGRNPAALVRISRATGVHIVMGCGAYVAQTHPAWIAESSTDELAGAFLQEARTGIGPAHIRPGVIGELGCSWPLADSERRVLVAGARVHARTGMAISIHPGRNRASPLQILGILDAGGANLRRVAMGHLDRTVQDLPGLLEIARLGPFLQFDLFGLETSFYPWPGVAEGLSDAQRLTLVRGLIDAGHGEQVLLSHDVCTKHRLARYGGHGYDHLIANVVPWMRLRGFSEAEIRMIFTTNPASLLGVRPA